MRSSSGGSSGFSLTGAVGTLLRIALKIAADVVPSNGSRPVHISYSTTPKENRSVRASSSSPSACSGLMYATVPSAKPGDVRCSALTPAVTPADSMTLPRSDITLANPKSRILAWPRSVTKMLAGLMSR